jgi:hypothetical protein
MRLGSHIILRFGSQECLLPVTRIPGRNAGAAHRRDGRHLKEAALTSDAARPRRLALVGKPAQSETHHGGVGELPERRAVGEGGAVPGRPEAVGRQ